MKYGHYKAHPTESANFHAHLVHRSMNKQTCMQNMNEIILMSDLSLNSVIVEDVIERLFKALNWALDLVVWCSILAA